MPAVYYAGASVMPTSSLTLSGDVRYITYESTEGFKRGSFAADGSVPGFGWKNIGVRSRIGTINCYFVMWLCVVAGTRRTT